MSQAPFDMIKVISSKQIDHVRIELDQIKWMEKNILTLCKRFLKTFGVFFQNKAHRGQTVDRPIGFVERSIRFVERPIGFVDTIPPSHRNRSYNINEIFS